MSRLLPLLFVFTLAASVSAEEKSKQNSGQRKPLILQVTLDDEAITPATARYLHRAIRTAEEQNAECLIIVLHTPGGVLDSTYDIVEDILASRVCVVVYVWPPSLGRAGSAGVFITLASHVAAMAPGTRIGAAHPVPAIPRFPTRPPEMEPPAKQKAPKEQQPPDKEEPPGKEEPPSEEKPVRKQQPPTEQESREKEERLGKQESPSEQEPSEKEEREPPGENGDREGSSEKRTPDFQEAMVEKVVNDTVAWARALAELRGRNAEWAARAVRESEVLLAREAIQQGVVDFGAADLEELLEKLDGREVTLPHGPHTLRTSDAEVHELSMSWTEQVLSVITRPNITFLLLICGFYAILFELYSPGWGVFGTLGIICLLLAAGGLALLPVNYLGLALIIVALALFVAEVFITSFGLLTMAGIVCLVLGGVMLVDSPIGFERVSLGVIVPLSVATAAITVFLLGGVVRAHRRRIQTGDEGLIGADAEARNDFSPRGDRYVGTVFVRGEWWTAISDTPVAAGQVCQIEQRQGLSLVVKTSS